MLSLTSTKGFSQYWTFGPTVHWYFNKGKSTFVPGVECAYWKARGTKDLPFSIDFGLEARRKKIAFYTEGQTALSPFGISAGLVGLYERGNSFKIGTQASVWAAALVGTDLRYRRIGGENHIAPGLFFKFIHDPGNAPSVPGIL